MLQLRRPGRPKGAKDQKPRARDESKQLLVPASCAALPVTRGSFQSESGLAGDMLLSECSHRGSFSVAANDVHQIDPFHDDWSHWSPRQGQSDFE